MEHERLVLESCHSTWIFDLARHRFCRELRGPQAGAATARTAWEPYHALELDERSERFTVVLNAEGTRLLQSWRHTGICDQCDTQATSQLTLADIGGHADGPAAGRRHLKTLRDLLDGSAGRDRSGRRRRTAGRLGRPSASAPSYSTARRQQHPGATPPNVVGPDRRLRRFGVGRAGPC